MNRHELKKVFEDTLQLSSTQFLYDGKMTILNSKNCVQPKIISDKRFIEINVTQNDCLDDVFFEKQKDPFKKILLINSASALNIGGGVRKGSNAQEECICRRSNLFNSLKKVDDVYGYPLHHKVKGILSKDVKIFKDAEYNLIEPFSVDILSLFSKPTKKLTLSEIQDINDQIFTNLFHFLYEHQPDILVMIPIGCGAFKHNPDNVSKIFKHYLDHYSVNENLEKIIISCYTNEENYDSFSYTFR